MALGMALVAANRQQTAAILMPAWLYACWRSQSPRWPKWLGAIGLTALFCFSWFVPMIVMSGGLEVYFDCLAAKKRMGTPYSGLAGGLPALLYNIKQIWLASWTGLVVAAFVMLVEPIRWLVFSPRESKTRFFSDHAEALWLLGLWVGPQIAFGLLIYTLMPGHILSYFPALALLAGLALASAAKAFGGRTALAAIAIAVAAVNAVVFLFEPAEARVLPLTAPRLREQHEAFNRCEGSIRARYKAEQVVLCHRGQFFYWGFRHFMFYLPEYRNVLLTVDESLPGRRSRQQWVAQGKKTSFVDRAELAETLLLVVPPGQTLRLFETEFDVRHAQLVPDTAGTIYELKLAETKLTRPPQ